MIAINRRQDCAGCSACASICPKQCISMGRDEEGFVYPQLDETECMNCHLCEKVCPILNKKSAEGDAPIVYASYNKDEHVRMHSSSGGIFSLFADWVLAQGGVVFGAGYGEKNKIIHKAARTSNELEELRGSKYVQTDICGIYLEVKKALNANEWVLFTGTPCQVQGVKTYLGKEYDKLVTQDLICHGVASPMVWEKYLQYHEKRQEAKVVGVSFRSKRKGWKKFSMELHFSNKKIYSQTLDKDAMLQFFLKDYSLRPACYDCKFKESKHISDITLADFWGIEHLKPEICEEKGVSLVFLNTDKAKKIFEGLKPKVCFELVSLESVIPYNSAILHSVKEPEKREQFFADIKEGNVDRVYCKYCLDPLPRRLINHVHRMLYNIKQKLKRRKDK